MDIFTSLAFVCVFFHIQVNSMRILLIDTGEIIDNEKNNLYALPFEIKSLPSGVIRCKVIRVNCFSIFIEFLVCQTLKRKKKIKKCCVYSKDWIQSMLNAIGII